MLLPAMLQTLKQIGNERLQLPIFYECPYALRFEIGTPSLMDRQTLYTRAALMRTHSLYVSSATYDTLLWIHYCSPDTLTSTHTQELLARFCLLADLPEPIEIYQQETTDSDGAPLLRIFFLWDMRQTPPDINALLRGIIQTDFMDFLELSSAVFFFDTTSHILLHLYDDRGMDIAAASIESLRSLYEQFPNWLLAYDRKRMDTLFQD